MKVAIMQPYFFPYIGYWQLINSVDTFVIYDDVNYIKKGYINRNTILINGQESLLTLSLLKASQNKLINEIEIGSNRKNILKTIELSYKKSPFFHEIFPILENIFYQSESNLSKFVTFSIIEISRYLEIETEFLTSSSIRKNIKLKAQDKIIDICSILEAKYYVNPIGGKSLYSSADFNNFGIGLLLLNPSIDQYNQCEYDFKSNLSIIDVLMYNSKIEVQVMIKNFTLE